MWILARTKPKKEKWAEENLKNQGFMTYLPYLHSKRYVKNKWIALKEVMFSGYLFIKVTENTSKIHKINNTFGVSKLLLNRDTGLPHILSNHEIEGLTKIVKKNNSGDMNKGDEVIITNGTQNKLKGTFLSKTKKSRAKILLDFLNKKHEVIVDLSAVQKLI